MELADYPFLCQHWLQVDYQHPAYLHLNPEVTQQMLALVQQLSDGAIWPGAAELDRNPPRIEAGKVHVPDVLNQNLRALAQAGMFGVSAPLAEGGLQLPILLQALINTQFCAADASVVAYVELTRGAANLIRNFGTEAQREHYLPKMVSGDWFGTMCLSEPHAGSSVGDARCKASALADGRFKIRGNKMWISGAEHELSENIVHLVLARIEGAPAGTKGLSLFIVPRFRFEHGAKHDNHVRLSGLNHKMGYRGTVNGALNFGESGDCIGELLGVAGAGMMQMFQMMNEARIAVGISGAALGWRGFKLALDYAKTRTQGRSLRAPDPTTPMLPIIEHADVKAMLLQARAQSEGAILLCLYAAHLADQAQEKSLPEHRTAHQLLSLLTPMVKSWPAKYALEANDLAIQVLAGAGYTQDFAAERLYRDNRLNAIHEGTRGIQGLDLLARKLWADQGAALLVLLQRIAASAQRAMQHPELREFAPTVLEIATELAGPILAYGKDPVILERALAHASRLLDTLGTLVVSWLSLDATCAALSEAPDSPLQRRLLANTRYLHQYLLPDARASVAILTVPGDLFLAGNEALGF